MVSLLLGMGIELVIVAQLMKARFCFFKEYVLLILYASLFANIFTKIPSTYLV